MAQTGIETLNEISDITEDFLCDSDFFLNDIWASAAPLSRFFGKIICDSELEIMVCFVLKEFEHDEVFDPQKPLFSGAAAAYDNNFIGKPIPIEIGTKKENGKTSMRVDTESLGALSDQDFKAVQHIAYYAMCYLLYVNCVFLTQPPQKSKPPHKIKTLKAYKKLISGQMVNSPQKVTFYKMPHEKEIDRRKIAAYKKEWKCPAWGVRGHYRHYKSGKVVFINAYIKGKDKSKYVGREYDISRIGGD